jgi:hypothetical protein
MPRHVLNAQLHVPELNRGPADKNFFRPGVQLVNLRHTSPVSSVTVETARQSIAWWEGAGGAFLGGLIGVVVGSFIPLLWSRWARAAERRGELHAMRAELYQARAAMNALSKTRPLVLAPPYHLPRSTFERALPKLIGEGSLTENEVAALVEYVMLAGELNRGFDLATQVQSGGGTLEAIVEQYKRNHAKVQHILHEKQERLGGLTVFDAAEGAIDRLSGNALPRRKPSVPDAR